jgi:hypothetical protein
MKKIIKRGDDVVLIFIVPKELLEISFSLRRSKMGTNPGLVYADSRRKRKIITNM